MDFFTDLAVCTRTEIAIKGVFPAEKASELFEEARQDMPVTMRYFYDTKSNSTRLQLFPCSLIADDDSNSCTRRLVVSGVMPRQTEQAIIDAYWKRFRKKAKKDKQPGQFVTLFVSREDEQSFLNFVIDSRCSNSNKSTALDAAVKEVQAILREIAETADLSPSAKDLDNVSMRLADSLATC